MGLSMDVPAAYLWALCALRGTAGYQNPSASKRRERVRALRADTTTEFAKCSSDGRQRGALNSSAWLKPNAAESSWRGP